MNTREQFLAVLNFEQPDRTLRWEMGYWGGTVRRWYSEGLPCVKGIPNTTADGSSIIGENLTKDPQTLDPIGTPERDKDINQYFCLDEPIWRLPLNNYLCPLYDEKLLEDHGDWVVYRNKYGVILKDRKDRAGFPNWESTPVTNRESWEQIKTERLSPTLKNRLPENWLQCKEVFKYRTYPLIIGGHPTGFYGTARFLLGEEKVMTEFYDAPRFMHEVMDYLADFWSELYDRVLSEISVDGILIWEDMCFKNGPLISPEMFREFILPGYKKVTDCLKSHGIRTVMVDTDGNWWELIPLFIEGGVTAMCPMEAAVGMDVEEVRKAFPGLAILGGIDKTKIKKGREAIDEELQKVARMLEHGGYVPHTDHLVPPDISWECFKYYRQKLNDLVESTRREKI